VEFSPETPELIARSQLVVTELKLNYIVFVLESLNVIEDILYLTRNEYVLKKALERCGKPVAPISELTSVVLTKHRIERVEVMTCGYYSIQLRW
jgi:hypothetical protein